MRKETILKFVRPFILVLCLFLIVSMGRSTIGLLGRDDAIKEAQDRVLELEEENAKLEALAKSINTDQFVEKEARDKLGMGREGETVLVLPSDEILKKLAPSLEEEVFLEEKPIFKRWIELFFSFN